MNTVGGGVEKQMKSEIEKKKEKNIFNEITLI